MWARIGTVFLSECRSRSCLWQTQCNRSGWISPKSGSNYFLKPIKWRRQKYVRVWYQVPNGFRRLGARGYTADISVSETQFLNQFSYDGIICKRCERWYFFIHPLWCTNFEMYRQSGVPIKKRRCVPKGTVAHEYRSDRSRSSAEWWSGTLALKWSVLPITRLGLLWNTNVGAGSTWLTFDPRSWRL